MVRHTLRQSLKNFLVILLLGLFAVPTHAQSLAGLVISQLYGGGGNSSATYRNDFVELWNGTLDTISLSGYSIQYASSTGSTWNVANLSGSIASGGFYLIHFASGGAVGALLPTADATSSINMAFGTGKVALVSSTAVLSGAAPTSASIVDFVGYGSSASFFEGSTPTPQASNTNPVYRMTVTLSGNAVNFQDSNVNGDDFLAGITTVRNSSSPNPFGANFVAIPEPETFGLTALGLAGLTLCRRRK